MPSPGRMTVLRASCTWMVRLIAAVEWILGSEPQGHHRPLPEASRLCSSSSLTSLNVCRDSSPALPESSPLSYPSRSRLFPDLATGPHACHLTLLPKGRRAAPWSAPPFTSLSGLGLYMMSQQHRVSKCNDSPKPPRDPRRPGWKQHQSGLGVSKHSSEEEQRLLFPSDP